TEASWRELKQAATQPAIREANLVVIDDPPAATTLGITFTQTAGLLAGIPPKVYLPKSVPCPETALGVEQRLLYWQGFQASVREVYELVKDAMEPPPAPRPKVER